MKHVEYLFIKAFLKKYNRKNVLLLSCCEPMIPYGFMVNLSKLLGIYLAESEVDRLIQNVDRDILLLDKKISDIFQINLIRSAEYNADMLIVRVKNRNVDPEVIKGLLRIYHIL